MSVRILVFNLAVPLTSSLWANHYSSRVTVFKRKEVDQIGIFQRDFGSRRGRSLEKKSMNKHVS